ncbi:DUF373 family protein [archaeon]|nr:DUF373 family protein [archaeon]
MRRPLHGRLLVLCVDEDDDLGTKTGLTTPVVGREANLMAAVQLATRDPEEADANAIFEAIRTYDRLVKELGSRYVEIATITGSPRGGIEAAHRILNSLDEVLERFPADYIVLVTDGFASPEVTSLISSRRPVASIRRVVIKHHASVEETYHVIARYLKMIVEEPRFSRYLLGLPGVLGLLALILYFLNLTHYFAYTLAFVVCTLLVVKGFHIDRAARQFARAAARTFYSPIFQAKLLVVSGSLILLGIGIYQATQVAIVVYDPLLGFRALQIAIAYWLQGASLFLMLAFIIFFSGRAVYKTLGRHPRALENFLGIIASVVFFYLFLYPISEYLLNPDSPILPLLLRLLIGIAVTVAATILFERYIHRRSAEQ